MNTFKTFLIGGLIAASQVLVAMPVQAAPSLCNGPANGVIDGDEQCETGPCCTNKCELASAATVCRASTDAVCDPAETCGEQTAAVDAACPADSLAADGTECDDDEFCTADDACAAGVCTGSGNACDDDNACTSDTCDERHDSCSHGAADDGTACDDGSPCTTDDVCSAGECSGTAVTCDDGNDCTDDSCSEETGECVATNNTASCDDGNFCTADDVCADGVCTGGGATACDDDDACTVDSCDEEADSCSHTAAADGTECDDGQFCTVGDTCAAGVCTGGGANDCSDDNDCTSDECMEQNDSCKHLKAANGTSCEDGSACTTDDTCSNGACIAGTATVCDDDNLCTNDSCNDESGGCVFTPNTIPCNDGQFCTVGDRCGGGVCVGGDAPNCDDDNVCTTDSCDEEADSCTNEAGNEGGECDDGIFCTVDDSCVAGKCTGGAPNPCDDEVQCTTDSCNIGLDECKHTPMNNGETCEDGSFCTVGDSCHAGLCVGADRDCSDDNVCTDDTCNEATDKCDNANNTLPCDDGQFCTTGDTCSNGTCSVSTPTCDDTNVCTTDSCDEAADTCSNVNNTDPCEDGLFCTAGDTCAAGACAAGPPRTCDDTNVCTNDSCNEDTDACVNANNTDPCDDTLFCTVGDTCANGVCSGTARDCADTNLCTTDTCNEAADACSNANNTAACDDGLFCTNGDACSGGACVAGPARDCGDANVCTSDACNEGTDACENVPNTSACDDGQFCTTGDVCSGGSCTGTPRSCDDSDECTTDSCNEAGDACSNVAIPSCGPSTTTTEEPPCPVCGNFFDDDCVLTASDALGVLQSAVGLHECSLTVCDFSGDGVITALDALAVLRAAVELPSDPSCPLTDTTTTLP